jgi:hypothetical protein
MKSILRLFATLLVLVSLSAGIARADSRSSGGERSSSALSYAIAGLSTVLVLITVCFPSRKTFYDD